MNTIDTPVKKTDKSKLWKKADGQLVPFESLSDEELSLAIRISESLVNKNYYLAEKLKRDLKKAEDICNLHTDLLTNLDNEQQLREKHKRIASTNA